MAGRADNERYIPVEKAQLVHQLANADAEEEECQEALLGDLFLMKTEGGLSARALEDGIEAWFKETFGAPIDVDIEDALGKLNRRGANCRQADGRPGLVGLNPHEQVGDTQCQSPAGNLTETRDGHDGHKSFGGRKAGNRFRQVGVGKPMSGKEASDQGQHLLKIGQVGVPHPSVARSGEFQHQHLSAGHQNIVKGFQGALFVLNVADAKRDRQGVKGGRPKG